MLERSEPMVNAEEPGAGIYVKNDAEGKYFPEPEANGCRQAAYGMGGNNH